MQFKKAHLKMQFLQGYNEHINPQVAIEFATAAFRMGHTLLPNHIIKMDKRYFPIGSLPLEEIFRNTSIVYQVCTATKLFYRASQIICNV